MSFGSKGLKSGVSICTAFIWLRIGSCEHGDEASGSLKVWEFLNQMSGYELLKKLSASWS
jgi:hypothetical protein